MKLEWHGPEANNNGKISFSVRQAAHVLNVSVNTASRAFHELQAKGFIVQPWPAVLGVTGQATCPTYELTELGSPDKPGEGKRLYKGWAPDREFEVKKAQANNPTGKNGKSPNPRKRRIPSQK